jgi:hypothetical protein
MGIDRRSITLCDAGHHAAHNRHAPGRGGPASVDRAPQAMRRSEAVVRPHMTEGGIAIGVGHEGRTTGSATGLGRDVHDGAEPGPPLPESRLSGWWAEPSPSRRTRSASTHWAPSPVVRCRLHAASVTARWPLAQLTPRPSTAWLPALVPIFYFLSSISSQFGVFFGFRCVLYVCTARGATGP